MLGTIDEYYHGQHGLLAYRIAGFTVAPVPVLQHPAKEDSPVSTAGLLLKAGGYVELPGIGFIDISEPGLYRLYSMDRNAALQWIVYDDCVTTLAASVSSIFYHFAAEPVDPSKSKPEQRQAAVAYALDRIKNGKVGGVCTTAADTFAAFCNQLSLRSIVWEFENISTAANNFSTHAMTEVFDPVQGKAVLFDIDRGYRFLDGNGIALSCSEFMEHTVRGLEITSKRINSKSFPGFGTAPRGGKNEDFLNDLFQIGGDAFDRDFYRIIGSAEIVFGIQHDDEQKWVTHLFAQKRAMSALEAKAGQLTEHQRLMLEQIQKFPVSNI